MHHPDIPLREMLSAVGTVLAERPDVGGAIVAGLLVGVAGVVLIGSRFGERFVR